MAAAVLAWNDPANELEELDDDITDLPLSPSSPKGGDRVIRRRSSRACDSCRKSKSRCQPTGDGKPCRSCMSLGTPCTFLGPSRKRGPPKGYIDAIESRLHQLEALLGIIISSTDPRAQSLVADLAQDSLARDIIDRVDNTPFGSKGRRKAAPSSREAFLAETGQVDVGSSTHSRQSSSKRVQLASRGLGNPADGNRPFVTPSNEWQDHLSSRVLANGLARQSGQLPAPAPFLSFDPPPAAPGALGAPVLPPLQIDVGAFSFPEDVKPSRNSAISPTAAYVQSLNSPVLQREVPNRSPNASVSPRRTRRRMDVDNTGATTARDWSSSPALSDGSTGDSDSDEVADAVGQLSLDENQQVRYHGKASGLHLLGKSDRRDNRHEGGIWRFPPARVWPPLANRVVRSEEELAARARLPPRDRQERLLELYFTYVHPVMPVVLKQQFMEEFRARSESPPYNEGDSPNSHPSQSSRKVGHRVPTLLLLAVFAIAARYDSIGGPLPPEGNMWAAGDNYLEDAKTILNQIYASSSPATCQALLLMSYREVGIGAMAQAWLYVGMAVRMAQDLGMNRSVDKWQRAGTSIFTDREKQLRRRIWYTCVIMDKYVSTYIGRPLSIFERDFDTPLPDEDPAEEHELWQENRSVPVGLEHHGMQNIEYEPVPSRPVANFNAAASLSSLVSQIIHSLYSIRAAHSSTRHGEADQLEKKLDKWYFDLPEYLRYEPWLKKLPIPPPHVLTMLMNYWNTVLLLHRPFIHIKRGSPADSPADDVTPTVANLKSLDMCMTAAAHISSIVAIYTDNFCLKRSAAFLSYYMFNAGVTHVTTLSLRPSNVQAKIGFQKCMDALKKMEVLWPSARRAWELLYGANVNAGESEIVRLRNPSADFRRKRVANEPVEDLRSETNGHATGSQSNSRSNSMSQPFVDMSAGDSYYTQYSRWTPDMGFSPTQPLHAASGQPVYTHASPVEPLSHMSSFLGPPPGANGRFQSYWGDSYETFGDPAALTSSLYNHPLPLVGSNLAPQGTTQAPAPPPMYDYPGYGGETPPPPPTQLAI